MKTRHPMVKPFWPDIAKAMIEYVRSGQYQSKGGKKREIINPHDKAFINFDDPEAACLAILIVGRGAYGIKGYDGLPLFLLGGDIEGWWKERFGRTIQESQDMSNDRLQAALLSMHLAGKRSSITDFVEAAHRYAEMLS